jgi:hypothetical protein
MTRQARRAMAALAGTLLLAACAGAATGPAPAPDGFTVALGIDPPKLVRFISTAPATRGKACYGRVVDAVDGVPRRVRLLPKEAGFDPCAGIPATPELAMRHLRDALERRKVERGPVETIAEAELATRLLPPVELRPAWLNTDEVFVVGAGLNYASHQAETGIDQFVLFPKPVVPTPAYGTLAFPAVANAPPICLLDHEVEIAFVALEDIDLHQDLTPASLWPRLPCGRRPHRAHATDPRFQARLHPGQEPAGLPAERPLARRRPRLGTDHGGAGRAAASPPHRQRRDQAAPECDFRCDARGPLRDPVPAGHTRSGRSGL